MTQRQKIRKLPEQDIVEKNGGKVIILPQSTDISSTDIMNKIMGLKGDGLFARRISGRSIKAQSLVYFFDKKHNFVAAMDYEECESFIHNIQAEMEEL